MAIICPEKVAFTLRPHFKGSFTDEDFVAGERDQAAAMTITSQAATSAA
jgi:hypothetical protein